MDKLLYLISEGVKNVWRHKMTTFTAVFSLFLALYFVGVLAIAGDNTHSVLQYLRSKYKIEVFFNQDVGPETAKGILDSIKEITGIRTATIIGKDDAVRIFKDQFGEDILSILGYNPLPISVVANMMRNSQDPLQVDPIVRKIEKIDGVAEVRYQGHLIKKIERTYAGIIKRFPILAGIFVMVAVLVIYNTVKLSVFSRKDLIKSLELIGATPAFIKMPFIFEGIIDGLLSALVAFPCVLATVNGLNYIMTNFTSWHIHLSLDPIIFVWLTLLAGIISVFGSYRAISGLLK